MEEPLGDSSEYDFVQVCQTNPNQFKYIEELQTYDLDLPSGSKVRLEFVKAREAYKRHRELGGTKLSTLSNALRIVRGKLKPEGNLVSIFGGLDPEKVLVAFVTVVEPEGEMTYYSEESYRTSYGVLKSKLISELEDIKSLKDLCPWAILDEEAYAYRCSEINPCRKFFSYKGEVYRCLGRTYDLPKLVEIFLNYYVEDLSEKELVELSGSKLLKLSKATVRDSIERYKKEVSEKTAKVKSLREELLSDLTSLEQSKFNIRMLEEQVLTQEDVDGILADIRNLKKVRDVRLEGVELVVTTEPIYWTDPEGNERFFGVYDIKRDLITNNISIHNRAYTFDGYDDNIGHPHVLYGETPCWGSVKPEILDALLKGFDKVAFVSLIYTTIRFLSTCSPFESAGKHYRKTLTVVGNEDTIEELIEVAYSDSPDPEYFEDLKSNLR